MQVRETEAVQLAAVGEASGMEVGGKRKREWDAEQDN